MNAHTRNKFCIGAILGLTSAWRLSALTVEEALPMPTEWPANAAIMVDRLGEAGSGIGCRPGAPVSQTVTPTKDMWLDGILLLYRFKADRGVDVTLRIQEVPEGPEADGYAEGRSLLASAAKFTVSKAVAEKALLRVSLSGGETVVLRANRTYAIEMTASGRGFTLLRRSSDCYSGGRAYAERRAVNAPHTRDIVLAVLSDAAEPLAPDQASSPEVNLAGGGGVPPPASP